MSDKPLVYSRHARGCPAVADASGEVTGTVAETLDASKQLTVPALR